MGATNAAEAAPGTIRGDFALEIGRNLIHGSDGSEGAEREVACSSARMRWCHTSRDMQRWITE